MTPHGPPTLWTRLTHEYGIRYPFVGAGMGFVSMPSLVAAVSNAGGLGVLGNGVEPAAGTQLLIRAVKASTSKPFGVGFMMDDSALGPLVTDAHIDVCVAERVGLVVFHMNVPPAWWVHRLHAIGAKVWMQVGSVQQAEQAVAAGMDAIVAQGTEAGGHNKSSTPLLKLLPAVVEAVHPTMVLASGGIADGKSVVRALSRGAEGVWVGTRLVASNEAYAHPEYKRRLAAATGKRTVITTMFGPEYPNRPYRVLRNRVVDEFAGKEDTIPKTASPPPEIGTTVLFPLTLLQPYEMPKLSAIVPTPETTGDLEEMGLPAGALSVKVIRQIKPAGDIVREMMGDAQRLIDAGRRGRAEEFAAQ